jgi:hypothetical protein
MDQTPEPAEGHLEEVVESLRDKEYDVSRPLPGVVHAKGRFSNPERIALSAAAVAGDEPVAVWAVSHRDDWVLVGWARPDLVTVTYRAPSPQRWRHRRIPGRMAPDAPTFLEGAASPFDIVTRPKHQPTDAAREVLARFGVTDPAPPGWEPPVVAAPEPTAVVVPAKKPRRTSTPRPAKPKPTPARRAEPTTKICPTCFMALPATGICDNCG